MSLREVNTQDWVEAVPFLVEAITISPTCLLVDVNIEHVLAHIMAAAERGGCAVVDEKYLVVYDKYTLWYSPTNTTLEEKLILDINPDKRGTIMSAIRYLVGEKATHKANHLIVGDLVHSDQEKYGRVLQKLGLQRVNTLYAC